MKTTLQELSDIFIVSIHFKKSSNISCIRVLGLGLISTFLLSMFVVHIKSTVT